MRKYLNIPILSVGLLVFGLVGCADDIEVSDPISTAGYSTATYTSDFTGGTIKEGDTIAFTITLDKQMDLDIPFGVSVGGELDDHDVEVINNTISAYTSETTMLVAFLQDYDIEATESGTIEIGCHHVGHRYRLHDNTQNLVLDVALENYVSDVLELAFEWGGEVEIASADGRLDDHSWTEEIASWVDMDIFMADAEGYDFSDPWATFNPSALAATGDNPEHIEVDFELLPEGSYYFFCALWVNEFSNFDTLYDVKHIDMPITTYYDRQGALTGSLVQDDSQVINSATAGEDDVLFADDWESIYTTLCKLTVTADEYVISDIDDNEIGRGKIDGKRSVRPDNLKK